MDIVSWANAKLEQQRISAQASRSCEPDVDCKELLERAETKRASPVQASVVNQVCVCVCVCFCVIMYVGFVMNQVCECMCVCV
jgi:hypothetical protein